MDGRGRAAVRLLNQPCRGPGPGGSSPRADPSAAEDTRSQIRQ